MNREEDQAKAMAAAGPVLAGLYGVLNDAVSFYFGPDYSDAARAEHTTRAVANNIYAHAEKRVQGFADSTSGMGIINVRGMVVANYLDVALFRFKKVNGDGKHSNYQTEQQQNYDDQLSFKELPDPAIRLTVGYELDAAGVGLNRIMIARPIGRSIFWTAQVTLIDPSSAVWQDITPDRLAGTDDSDFDAERARKRRGRRG